ncbi:MAG: FAD-dependent oxidoreductase, partial [Cyanobacteriota bacterium]
QFTALEIPHLRSPAVHHPDPDPYALRRFAESRWDELFPPYDLPGTTLFREFCQDVVRRWNLADQVYPAQVVRVQTVGDRRYCRFLLSLSTGETIIARRVVLASGSGCPHLPDWVQQIPTGYPGDRLLHSSQVNLQHLKLQGERVLIVGGGLTSGHLAIGAIRRGARVMLMARRTIYEKLFDVDPGWLGPKYLKDFWAEPDWSARWQMIQQARNGGSMTPAILTQLRRLAREGHLEFFEQCQVSKATWVQHEASQSSDPVSKDPVSNPAFEAQAVNLAQPESTERGKLGYWRVCCNHPAQHACIHSQEIHRIWLATGSQLDGTRHPLLQDIAAQYPVTWVNGLPVLEESLQWPGVGLYIMGGLAALHVGPTARNLSGARSASDRIVKALLA